MGETAKLLAGSAIIYAVVASCSDGSQRTETGGALASGGQLAASGPGGNVATDFDSGSIRAPTEGSGGALAQLDAAIDRVLSPVPDAQAQPQSGTRLKAVFLLGEDGSRHQRFLQWHDSLRGERCSFELATDGVERCLPLYLGSAGVNDSAFADPGCSQPIAISSSCAGSPRYASRIIQSCPTSTRAVFDLGPQIPGSVYYLQIGAACTEVPLPEGQAAYELGQEVPPSSFVSATEEIAP